MSISKRIIAKEISEKLGSSVKNSTKFLDSFLDIIKKNSTKNKVKISKFGTFDYKITPERVGRNPNTKDIYKIKSFNRFVFKPAIKLKKNINRYNKNI